MTSLRAYRDADGKHFIRNGNFIRLDRCGCQIWKSLLYEGGPRLNVLSL